MPEPSVVTPPQVMAFLQQVGMAGIGKVVVEALHADFARVRWTYDPTATRPGGMISGPTMMTLADLTAWVVVFTRAGLTPMAVTWELKINFLRPAIGKDLIADATMHRFGRLSHASVALYLDGEPDTLVAHASVTYAVPKPATD